MEDICCLTGVTQTELHWFLEVSAKMFVQNLQNAKPHFLSPCVDLVFQFKGFKIKKLQFYNISY